MQIYISDILDSWSFKMKEISTVSFYFDDYKKYQFDEMQNYVD